MITHSKYFLLTWVIVFFILYFIASLASMAEGFSLFCIDVRPCVEGEPIPWNRFLLSMSALVFSSLVMALVGTWGRISGSTEK